MNYLEAIDAAVEAHTKWFTRLGMAIQQGTSEFKPDTVKLDNQCDFGKWLYSSFPHSPSNQQLFGQIKSAHARFHQQAAEILQLAISGKKDEALHLMDNGAPLRKTSHELLNLLRMLKKTF